MRINFYKVTVLWANHPTEILDAVEAFGEPQAIKNATEGRGKGHYDAANSKAVLVTTKLSFNCK